MTGSLPPPLVSVPVAVHHADAAPASGPDTVAAEVPVALVFNGLSHAVMMATPDALEAFGVGFALSEGIVDRVADCRDVTVRAVEANGVQACEVAMDISPRAFAALKDRRRNLAGRTGCGLCGIDSLAALDQPPARLSPGLPIAAEAIARAFIDMAPLQVLNAAAGSLHAAAWCSMDGVPLRVCEDVGRHNALDKLIGRLALDGRLGEPGFVAMTSRASYELVQKCARMELGALATISAPTALAVQLAERTGLQLWGLCRGPRAVRYGGFWP